MASIPEIFESMAYGPAPEAAAPAQAWLEQHSRRFGLFYVDYQTQERLWKDSGLWYRDLVRAPVAAD